MKSDDRNRDHHDPPRRSAQDLFKPDQNCQQAVGKRFKGIAIIHHQPVDKAIDPFAQGHIQLFWKHRVRPAGCVQKTNERRSLAI